MKEPIHVDLSNFEKEIQTAKGAVLADFWAEWCMPCQMMAPVFAAVCQKYENVKFCKINVDEAPELATRYGIDSIPAILAIRDGAVVDTTVGYQDEAALSRFVESAL